MKQKRTNSNESTHHDIDLRFRAPHEGAAHVNGFHHLTLAPVVHLAVVRETVLEAAGDADQNVAAATIIIIIIILRR